MSLVEREDWKNVIDMFTNAKQVVSSVQDVAWKLADYANFRNKRTSSGKLALNCPQGFQLLTHTHAQTLICAYMYNIVLNLSQP
jgi:hypothetical protein